MVVFARRVNGMTGEEEWETEEDDYDFHQEISRSGFADMLHDYERNDKYFLALGAAVKRMHDEGKPANVLDIGTGTGLLSIMAARLGADSVFACEAFAPMSVCAKQIIEKNGLADKIVVVPKRSTDLTVGEGGDLPFKFNILVTEVFDTELIGEGAIETFSRASAELLEEDRIVVPDSATVYAQIVECPFLLDWNRLSDTKDSEGNIVVTIPSDIRNCPGSIAVHDVQLNQLPIDAFVAISDPIPVFEFDWTDKIKLEKKRTSKVDIKASKSGTAEMVFMWWDLKMDTDGKIILSCAPWWHHPDADRNAAHPEDTIPWRDHWMQAIYYFPNDVVVNANDNLCLVSSHDEFSLWFDLWKGERTNDEIQPHPICDCGIHMSYSRTHIAYMNDSEKNINFLNLLKENINEDSVCLCLNGGSLMGLASAKLGAKRVIYIEPGVISRKVLDSFISFNKLSDKVSVLPDIKLLSKIDLKNISLVIGDPHYNSAILPWDNFRHGYYATKLGLLSNPKLKLIPSSCSIWVMSVEFLDLNKIKTPLGTYKGIDFGIFDDLMKSSRIKSDDEIEPQPLWEYPCICKSMPVHIGTVKFLEESSQTFKGTVKCDIEGTYNGFVFWLKWNLDEACNYVINTGPLVDPKLNERVKWDPRIRQAVKILEKNAVQCKRDVLKYQFAYDLSRGVVNANVDIISDC